MNRVFSTVVNVYKPSAPSLWVANSPGVQARGQICQHGLPEALRHPSLLHNSLTHLQGNERAFVWHRILK